MTAAKKTSIASSFQLPPDPQPPVVAGGAEFLLDISEAGKRRSFRMIQDSLRIGRGTDCDIVVVDSNASRLHAILQRQGDELMLLENHTRNGTLVNGLRVDRLVKLNSGDVIHIGAMQIVFRKFVRKENAMARVTRSVPSRMTVQQPLAFISKDKAETFASPIAVPKKAIPKRFYIYGVVGIVLIALLTAKTQAPSVNDVDVRSVATNPVDAYQKLQSAAAGDGKKKEAMLSATQKVSEASTKIVLDLETKLLKDEQQRILDELQNSKTFGKPFYAFKDKLAQEHVFSGIREYNYRNYARSEEHLRAALILDPTMEVAQQYLQSALNRRRIMALEEFKIAARYFERRKYSAAITNFKAVKNLLIKDKDEKLEGDWASLLKWCDDYIHLADQALGKQNIYSNDPRGMQ